MIGLGPHEMTAWLWVFSVSLAIALAGFAALTINIAGRLPRPPARRGSGT